MKHLIALVILINSYLSYAEGFEGVWEATSTVYAGGPQTISEDEAKLFIGKKLNLLSNSVTYEGITCENPVYSYVYEKINSDEFYSAFRTSLSDIGVTVKTVDIRQIDCGKGWYQFGYLFLYAPEDQLIVIQDGYFFKMKRN